MRRASLFLATIAFAAPAPAQPRDAAVEADPGDEAITPEAPQPDAGAAPVVEDGVVEGAALPSSPLRATEIGALSGRACLRALVRAGVPFERMRWASSGVATPVIVTGPIAGVTIHTSHGQRPHETMDCLLALALVRYSRFLRARGVRELRHLSVHRPATPSEILRHPVLPRHPGGMAIDAAVFVLDDGTEYNVTRDFHGRLGAPPCGPTARVPPLPEARFLRRLFCDAAREGLFHVALSPNYNDEHHNHFHLEITRSVSWQFVR